MLNTLRFSNDQAQAGALIVATPQLETTTGMEIAKTGDQPASRTGCGWLNFGKDGLVNVK